MLVQEHVDNVKQQFAHTMAELAQLRLREQQLTAKNHLLEKVALLNSKQKASRASSLVSNRRTLFQGVNAQFHEFQMLEHNVGASILQMQEHWHDKKHSQKCGMSCIMFVSMPGEFNCPDLASLVSTHRI